MKNIAENVIDFKRSDYIKSCFIESFEYFSSYKSDSDCSSVEDDNGTETNSHSKYSFYDCIQSQNTICDDSDNDSDYSTCGTPQETTRQIGNLPTASENALKCVNQALSEIYDEFVLSDANINGRKVFVEELEKYLQKIIPRAQLTLFGSSVSGFGFRKSDIDICLTLKGNSKNSINTVQTLRSITRHLRKNKIYSDVIALFSAQIPIVKFCFTRQNWNCDLSLYNVLAVHNSTLLCKYAMLDRRCQVLGAAVKYLAKKAMIADCAAKSLSSYSYVLMTIHYLQQVDPPVLPVIPVCDKQVFENNLEVPESVLRNRNFWFSETPRDLKRRYPLKESNNSSPAELFLGFLEFYLKLDYEHTVNITEKDVVLSSTLLRSARLFNIEDPFLEKKNLGCIVSDSKAGEIYRILHRSRSLFARKPNDNAGNVMKYYFSSSNLTGRIIKEVECLSCGAFGHEKSACVKANPLEKGRKRRFLNPGIRK